MGSLLIKINRNVIQKQKDIEKLNIHKGQWKKEMKVVISQHESIQLDEIGSSRHILRKNKKQ